MANLTEEDAAVLLRDVIDPLLKATSIYVNKMRTGEVPVDMESWIFVKRVLYGMFEIPEGTLPDSPLQLEQPLQFSTPFGSERIS